MGCLITFQQRSDTFFVEELLHYRPSGAGEHYFVKLEKRNLSTPAVERKISERTGVPLRFIRRAGRKDAAATALQWFSWPVIHQKREMCDLQGVVVREITKHEHGLAVGHARANRFSLSLHRAPVGPDDPGRISFPSFPNFYGRQRFGRNPPKPGEIADRLKRPVRGSSAREEISVLQSLLFNELLGIRWNSSGFETGADDWWTASNGKRCFQAPPDEALARRYLEGEIVPTGPMYGYKLRLNRAETSFLVERGIAVEDFRAWGKIARGARRPLFAKPEAASCEAMGDATIRLNFELPSGAFATVLLMAVFLPDSFGRPMESWPDFTGNTVLRENLSR